MTSPPPRLRSGSLWLLILGAVALLVLVLASFGLSSFFLVLAGTALALAVFLLHSSLLGLTGETDLTFEEAYTLAAPSREEEQKRAVLRALKDLEYERSVGKISPEDYAELQTRYRAEAKRLLQLVDENRADQLRQAEALYEKRRQNESDRLAASARRSKAESEDDEAQDEQGASDDDSDSDPSNSDPPPDDPPPDDRDDSDEAPSENETSSDDHPSK